MSGTDAEAMSGGLALAGFEGELSETGFLATVCIVTIPCAASPWNNHAVIAAVTRESDRETQTQRYLRLQPLHAGKPPASLSSITSSPFVTVTAMIAGLPSNVIREPFTAILSLGRILTS